AGACSSWPCSCSCPSRSWSTPADRNDSSVGGRWLVQQGPARNFVAEFSDEGRIIFFDLRNARVVQTRNYSASIGTQEHYDDVRLSNGVQRRFGGFLADTGADLANGLPIEIARRLAPGIAVGAHEQERVGRTARGRLLQLIRE